MIRGHGIASISRSLFARLLGTHLLTAAGVVLIVVLITIDALSGAVAALVSFALLGLLMALLSAIIARGVAFPLARIRSEVERAGGGPLPSIDATDEGGSSVLVSAVNRLATDLAARVEELRAETTLREQILSAMDEGVLLAEGTKVIYANPAARDLFNLGGNALIPPSVPVPGESSRVVTKEITQHHPFIREIRCTSTLVGEDKTLIVAQDVTDAKRTERVRRDFVANASHELKTPVAGILATAETLDDAMQHDPEVAVRFARTLTKEAKRLSNLVRDLLSLARLEQTLRIPDPTPLASVIDQVVEELRPAADAKNLDLKVTLDDTITVGGSAQDLALMARNLLDNAIRYTPDGGGVIVTLERAAGRAVLTVEDTGIGIPARDLPRIFERFYRVDKARSRDTGGTGLGLSIVRHVAENHGGTVTAASELGAGSTFAVTLPLRSEG